MQVSLNNSNKINFKALKIAYDCGKIGGSLPVCMNAVNEEAVFAFLEGKIKLIDIINSIERVLEKHSIVKDPNIDDIFEIDKEARIISRELFHKLS